jgi:hypothetical protein
MLLAKVKRYERKQKCRAKSGCFGVYWDNRRKKWLVYGKRSEYLGGFKNKEEAVALRKNWEYINMLAEEYALDGVSS